jgi:hypothetical protein
MKSILIVSVFFCVLAVGSFKLPKNIFKKGQLQQNNQSINQTKIEDWGPQETPEKTKFNIQPNGLSAMWVKVEGVSMHPKTHVSFGGQEISGADLAVQDEAVTFIVRDELIQKSGSYEVAIIEGDAGRKIFVGQFLVKTNFKNE